MPDIRIAEMVNLVKQYGSEREAAVFHSVLPEDSEDCCDCPEETAVEHHETEATKKLNELRVLTNRIIHDVRTAALRDCRIIVEATLSEGAWAKTQALLLSRLDALMGEKEVQHDGKAD